MKDIFSAALIPFSFGLGIVLAGAACLALGLNPASHGLADLVGMGTFVVTVAAGFVAASRIETL